MWGRRLCVLLGVTDQHSQVQLYTEGPFDKIITFIKVENFRTELVIPKAPINVYDAEYLAGQSFNKLIASELQGDGICRMQRQAK